MSDSETARNICSSCGKTTPADAAFCLYCGAQMKGGQQTVGSRFCAACGYARTSDAVFCEKCGVHSNGGQQTAATGGGASRIEANEAERVKTTVSGAQTYAAAGQKVPDNKGRPRAGKWVLIGAVGLIGLLGAAGILITNSGWKMPNVLAPTAENDAPPSTSIAPSAPSIPRSDKYVAAVRGGVLGAPYNTTTVGKAFEATFIDCKWVSKESDKGARFVEFTGRLKPEMYKMLYNIVTNSCHQNDIVREVSTCPTEVDSSTVIFQFVFSIDGTSFRLGHIDEKAWAYTKLDVKSVDTILSYIYQ